MNGFYTQTESNIFCGLIIVFLYFFRKNNFQEDNKNSKWLYVFSLITVIFCASGDIIKNEFIRKICFVLCGVGGFFSMSFCLKCVGGIAEYKNNFINKVLFLIISLMFGFITCNLSLNGIKAAIYLICFIVIGLFALEQYNIIRIDNLTKLYNRYGMDVELKKQLKQYERENSDSFYIIACDLDNFKRINDTWGHSEGDRALVLIAGALARVSKKFSSEVFRIGGDEFIIITDTSEEGLANDVTKEIKAELDEIEFRSDFDIKMSIGVALYDGVTSIDDLLNNADKKMYEAKKKEKDSKK